VYKFNYKKNIATMVVQKNKSGTTHNTATRKNKLWHGGRIMADKLLVTL